MDTALKDLGEELAVKAWSQSTSHGDPEPLSWRLEPTERRLHRWESVLRWWRSFPDSSGPRSEQQAEQALQGQLRGPQDLHQFVSSSSSAGPAAQPGCHLVAATAASQQASSPRHQHNAAAERHPSLSQSGHCISLPAHQPIPE